MRCEFGVTVVRPIRIGKQVDCGTGPALYPHHGITSGLVLYGSTISIPYVCDPLPPDAWP